MIQISSLVRASHRTSPRKVAEFRKWSKWRRTQYAHMSSALPFKLRTYCSTERPLRALSPKGDSIRGACRRSVFNRSELRHSGHEACLVRAGSRWRQLDLLLMACVGLFDANSEIHKNESNRKCATPSARGFTLRRSQFASEMTAAYDAYSIFFPAKIPSAPTAPRIAVVVRG